MEKSNPVCCVNGHYASEFCTLAKCPHPSSICVQPDCQYSKLHTKCTYVKSQSLVQRLISKDLKIKNEEQELVVGALNKMIKDIQMSKNQYLDKRKDIRASAKLKEQEQKLYEFVRDEKWGDIKSKLVLYVANHIEDKYDKEQQKSLRQLEKAIEKLMLQHGKKLDEFKKMIKSRQSSLSSSKNSLAFTLVPFKFMSQLDNENKVEILNNSTLIRHKLRQRNNKSSRITSMVASSLLPYNNTIRLRLNKNYSNKVFLGVNLKYRPNPIAGNSAMFTFYKYTVSCEGFMCYSLDRQHNKNKVQFQYDEGETVQLQYEHNCLYFKNLNTGDEHSVIFYNISMIESFEFCVVMQKYGDEWEILGK